MIRKLSLMLIIVFFIISTISAQDFEEPSAKITYGKNGISGIFWVDKSTDASCVKSYASLRLVKILYPDDEDAYQIGNLIFSNNKGIREEFMFSLNTSEYSTVDSSHLKTFIGEGNQYKVGAFRCGAGGNSDPTIFSLEKIVYKKTKQK